MGALAKTAADFCANARKCALDARKCKIMLKNEINAGIIKSKKPTICKDVLDS